MILQTPLIFGGKSYDRITVSLAISTRYLPNGTMDASVAMQMTPTRISDDGMSIETLENKAKEIFRGSLQELSGQKEANAFAAINQVIERFAGSRNWNVKV